MNMYDYAMIVIAVVAILLLIYLLYREKHHEEIITSVLEEKIKKDKIKYEKDLDKVFNYTKVKTIPLLEEESTNLSEDKGEDLGKI